MALYEYIADGGLFDSYGGLLLFSGEATVTTRFVHRPIPSGGMTVGGSVAVLRTKSYTASSGVNTGHSARVAKGKTYPLTSGGLTTGSAASVARARLYTGTGDLETDGAGTTVQAHCNTWVAHGVMIFIPRVAVHSKTKEYPATSGGLTSSGGAVTTTTTYESVYAASGGLTTGDGAAVLVTKAYEASAGLSSGGSATVTTTVVTVQTYVASSGLTSGGSATVSRTIVVIKTYVASAGLSSSGSATTAVVNLVAYPYTSLGRVGVFGGSVYVKRTKAYTSSSSEISLGGSATTSKAQFALYTSTGSISFAGACTSATGNGFLIIAELFSVTYYPRMIFLPTRTLHVPGHTKVYVSMTGKEFGFCLRAYPGLRVRAHRQVQDHVYIPSGGIDMDGSDCA